MNSFLTVSKKMKTRDKILRSALILFVEKGFFNTSISDLVKFSGVSSGSIYHSFKDKQDLAETLIEELIAYIEHEQQNILAQYTTTWDRYYQLSKSILESAENNPQMMQFILRAQHQEFMPEHPPICSSKPFMTLRDVINQGIEEGELREMDIMLAASLAFGGILRIVQLKLDGLVEKPLTDYLEEITQTSWLALKN